MRINFLYIYSLLFSTLAFISYTQEITVSLAQLTNTLQQLSSYLSITTLPADKQAEDALKSLQGIIAALEKSSPATTIELLINHAPAINQNIQIINNSYTSLSAQFQTTIKQFFTNFNAQLASLLLKGFKGLKLDQESVTEIEPWAVGSYNKASWDTFINAFAAYRAMQNQYLNYLTDKNITMPILEDPVLHSIISTFHNFIGTSFLRYLMYISDIMFLNVYLSLFPNIPMKPIKNFAIESIRERAIIVLNAISTNIQALLDVVLRIKPYIKLNTKVFTFELQWLGLLADMNISFNDLLLNSSMNRSIGEFIFRSLYIMPSLQLGIPFSGNFKDMFIQAFYRFIKIILLIRPDQVAKSGAFDNLAASTEYEEFSSGEFEKYTKAYHFFAEPTSSEENENLYDLLFNSSKNTPVQFVNGLTQLDFNKNFFKELDTAIQDFFNHVRPLVAEALKDIEK